MEFRHSKLDLLGVGIHVAEMGTGPMVLFVHGFPEIWYSWRHQMRAVAAAGYRAVALDLRGFGGSDQPAALGSYTRLHYVGDLVGVVHALGEKNAVLVGHDWGAPICWTAAQLRPDLFRAIFALSVPFAPRAPAPPTTRMKRTDTEEFYQLYYGRPGLAEVDLGRDQYDTLLRFYWGGSAEGKPQPEVIGSGLSGMVPTDGGILAVRLRPDRLPSWLTADDLAVFVSAYENSGFEKALNLYRIVDRDWELLAPLDGRKVVVPAQFMAGDRDMVLGFAGMDKLIAQMPDRVPELVSSEIVPDCGHWIQQEKADYVSDALLKFLGRL